MTPTTTIPLADLAGLDFHYKPVCEVTEPDRNGRHKHCDKPAAWLGTAPCGCESYSCDPHRRCPGLYTCLQCGIRGMSRSTYKWVRL